MFIKVKDVGNYKIHVKESTTRTGYSVLVYIICWIVIALWVYSISILPIGDNNSIIVRFFLCLYIFLGFVFSFLVGVFSLDIILDREMLPLRFTFRTPTYYVDTTMYGVGGKTIRKTTPAQDHIAICQAAQEFEKEILERINKEKELEEIVGKCK